MQANQVLHNRPMAILLQICMTGACSPYRWANERERERCRRFYSYTVYIANLTSAFTFWNPPSSHPLVTDLVLPAYSASFISRGACIQRSWCVNTCLLPLRTSICLYSHVTRAESSIVLTSCHSNTLTNVFCWIISLHSRRSFQGNHREIFN